MRLSKEFNGISESFVQSYVLPLLWKMQKGLCANCSLELAEYQVNHKRYAMDLTLKDLELLCMGCHAKHHGHKKATGVARKNKPYLAKTSQN